MRAMNMLGKAEEKVRHCGTYMYIYNCTWNVMTCGGHTCNCIIMGTHVYV